MPLNWRRRHFRQQNKQQKQQREASPGRSRPFDALHRGRGTQDGGGKGMEGGNSGTDFGCGNEEMEVLGALDAYRDLLGRPQKGSPGKLVNRLVTLQEVSASFVASMERVVIVGWRKGRLCERQVLLGGLLDQESCVRKS
jgi:hypothetical protein